MSDSDELRAGFTGFFERAGHTVVPSASLLPANDPTLMFTNAGMVQFKDVFVGTESRDYSRATTAQKVMRVSGKHNDLEEVGRTTRHHTFFEMLGNFSFGDYFKAEAIELAWRYVVEEMAFPAERIWVTVFGGESGFAPDDEARSLWRRISELPDERIVDRGMKDNFWSMGDVGPCGPCTEIHLDTGKGPVREDDFENGRVMEFWNLVFMQFERQAGGLVDLPKPSVDTGMGLERLLALQAGVDSTFHTDAFLPSIELTAELAEKTYGRGDNEDDVSLRVIADHARATAFLIADGLQPAKTGRGYVMRRIMRRAIRHGRRLGFEQPFFHRVCDHVVERMGAAYPELSEARTLISKVAETEEVSFRRTLDTGLKLLEKAMDESGDNRELSGQAVFTLYDTYGFPKDLTETIATEHGYRIDEAGFDREMAAQKMLSQGSDLGGSAVAEVYKELARELPKTTFVGYPQEDTALEERSERWRRSDGLVQVQTEIRALIQNNRRVERAGSGEIEVMLDPNPFYGESGGQLGDTGVIEADGLRIRVTDAQRPTAGQTFARGTITTGEAVVGESVWAGYDIERRRATRNHHSATHLVHAALRSVLGDHVRQAGSLNAPDRLRFDFSHFEATTDEQLQTIERDCNRRVRDDDLVITEVLPYEQAKRKGAIALFGEKYGDEVRVVTMGDSIEFCGGTHSRRTGEIELILITREDAIASGVRRIEASVGDSARELVRNTVEKLNAAAALLRGEDTSFEEPTLRALEKLWRQSAPDSATLRSEPPQQIELSDEIGIEKATAIRDRFATLVRWVNAKGSDLPRLVEQLEERDDPEGILRRFAELVALQRNQDKERQREAARTHVDLARDLMTQVVAVGSIQVVAARADGVDGKALRQLADAVRDSLRSGVIALGADNKGKAALLVAVTPDLTGRFQAGSLIRELAPMIAGRGGGKPELAQAGGTDTDGLDRALAHLKELIANG